MSNWWQDKSQCEQSPRDIWEMIVIMSCIYYCYLKIQLVKCEWLNLQRIEEPVFSGCQHCHTSATDLYVFHLALAQIFLPTINQKQTDEEET